MKRLPSDHLTKQQQYLLYQFYRFRFLYIATLTTLLNHKLSTRVQSWVKDLTDKGYLYQFYDKTTFYGRTRPALYCLTSKRKKVLENNPKCERTVLTTLYREKTRSSTFQNHCLEVTSLLLSIEALEKTEDSEMVFFTRNELVSYKHFPQPLPDAFLARKKNKLTKRRYFLELLDETLPRRIIRIKLERYFTSYNGDWDEMTGNIPFPIILLVVTKTSNLRKVKKIVQRILDDEYHQLLFYITSLIESPS